MGQRQLRCDRASSRLDRLAAEGFGLRRAQVSKAIKERRLYLNDQVVKKGGVPLASGDLLTLIEEEIARPEARCLPLHIVYEDESLILVNKPAGQLVHPVHGETDTLVNALLAHTDLPEGPDLARPGVVHRLDKDTSGLVLFAKSDEALARLSEGFAAHAYHRRYLAIVEGTLSERCFTIDQPIARITGHAMKRQIDPTGRPARTHVELLAVGGGDSLVSCILDTGRTHQIRVHLASIGHPLVGDWLYGHSNNPYGFPGQALHSWYLALRHPLTGLPLRFFAAPPLLFRRAMLHPFDCR